MTHLSAAATEDAEAADAAPASASASTATTTTAAQAKPPQQPWPATLPEQVRAVAEVLGGSPTPLPLPAIEARFKGRGSWKKGLPTLLQTLEALGRAQVVPTESGPAWRAS